MASTIASTTATPAMIVYWRRRYALAPSWTAVEMSCISWLPGESDKSQRDVSTPYSTAAPEQTSAITTPQSVRNSKGYVLRLDSEESARGARYWWTIALSSAVAQMSSGCGPILGTARTKRARSLSRFSANAPNAASADTGGTSGMPSSPTS